LVLGFHDRFQSQNDASIVDANFCALGRDFHLASWQQAMVANLKGEG
jgi:hypothetical protein